MLYYVLSISVVVCLVLRLAIAFSFPHAMHWRLGWCSQFSFVHGPANGLCCSRQSVIPSFGDTLCSCRMSGGYIDEAGEVYFVTMVSYDEAECEMA
jgi:hypothetical protein